MNQLRLRLLLIFTAATLAPMGVTLWVANALVDRATGQPSTAALDRVSKTLESTARAYYQREREALLQAIGAGTATAEPWGEVPRRQWPAEVEEFWESADNQRFLVAGPHGESLWLLRRTPSGPIRFSRSLTGVRLAEIRRDYAQARAVVSQAQTRDLERMRWAVLALAALPWLAALGLLLYSVHRVTYVASQAYSRMAEQLQQSRDRLLYLTRLESWQALARKTAHEVKNSLTPIRLTIEELAARAPGGPASFEHQAARIIVDEVNRLERRVRAFSDFAAEPPVRVRQLDPLELVNERVAFLRAAHPEVHYDIEASNAPTVVLADEDLLKAILTNLLANAAEAAGPHGSVLVKAEPAAGQIAIEVHDSGPGLSPANLDTLFEPTISFKKGGMGLGLSIARKAALLLGGDIVLVKGELGGAGFRVLLATACPQSAS